MRSFILPGTASRLTPKEGQPRLLTVDNEVYVPVNKVVKVLITANDDRRVMLFVYTFLFTR